ncbi:metalloendopeptidase OMA1, mitochondrial-like isoform X1 [Hylaeus volcanicus]|uniref:metalloendopeptidase OMA1, mitochondrial-like isoform X1 n=3 Tax=Hylaeus volcanicus TaxID=313075 RepID=UPI0023B7DB60|nr:metalloendopeptidase OMA1, mitochondrial-like isoform X1 [Hylaeus volcanicus]XP_053990576.1 metalloendopeptidase OMA1, mitochondrial-like isoform X1 [Hylaeus volcanicus]
MNMYKVRILHVKRLQFVTIRTIMCATERMSFITPPERYCLQCKKFERKWRGSKLQTSNFHTTKTLYISPFVMMMVCTSLKLGSICTGYYMRRLWLKKTPSKQEEYKRWYWERRNTFFGSLVVVSSILLIYYLTHLERDPIEKRLRFIMFDEADQVAIGNYIFMMLSTIYKDKFVSTYHPMYWRLSMIVKNLAHANKEIFKNTKWSIHIIDFPIANAMVLPSGHVFVFSGIFHVVNNNDQLAFMLAHEMSHVMLLHTVETFSYEIMKNIVISIPLFFIWSCFSSWRALSICLGSGLLHNILFFYPYRRRLEIEADKIGFQIAAKSCIDVREVLTMFDQIEKNTDIMEAMKYQIPLLMTHPTFENRKKRIVREIPNAMKLRSQAGCPQLHSRNRRKELHLLVELEDLLREYGIL